MRWTIALLVILNVGMAGLYVLQFRIADDVRAIVAVGKDPISARWRVASGTEFVVTKGSENGDFHAQTQALAMRLESMQRVFVPVDR